MKKVSVEKMKEYLWHAMQFETYVYIWSKAMNEANNKMKGVYAERKRLQDKKREAIPHGSRLRKSTQRKERRTRTV